MTLGDVMSRVERDDTLETVLSGLGALPEAVRLSHDDVRRLSHYMRRLRLRSNDSTLVPLVEAVNRRFVKPMFAPSTPSDYQPKAIVFGLDRFPTPGHVRAVIDRLLADPVLTTFKTLVEGMGEEAVLSVVAPLVARTVKDLYVEAGGRSPRGDRLERVWRVVDAIVEGEGAFEDVGRGGLPEPRRPIELRQSWVPDPPDRGWARLKRYATAGVPYELMVLQRTVGNAFGTAQNASSEQVAAYLGDLFLRRHASSVGLPFLRAIDGATQPYPPYVTKAEMERITSVTPSPDIAFVRPAGAVVALWQGTEVPGYVPDPGTYSPEHVVAVVEAKVASDGGTARQKCDEIRRQFALVAGRPGLLAAALVEGSGWNARRAEVARLCLDIAGRLYRLDRAPALVEAIRSRL